MFTNCYFKKPPFLNLIFLKNIKNKIIYKRLFCKKIIFKFIYDI